MKHLFVLILLTCCSPAFGEGAIADAVVRIGGCSGVCVDEAGIVLTAKHCDLPEATTVVFPNRRPVEAVRVYVGSDAEDVVAYDAAGTGWPSATVATSVPEPGSTVRSAGYPVRVMGRANPERSIRWVSGTLTGGGRMTFSRNRRPLGQFDGNTTSFATGPGWSGGPLFNSAGEVIGILSAGDAGGSIYISWAATRRALDEALAMQAGSRPHLLIFGYEECRYCRAVQRDIDAGRFDDYDYEYVDVVADEDGMLRYEQLAAALEKATGREQPEGFPAFHLAGRASLFVGYAPAGSGWSRLGNWLTETLRLPVTIPQAVIDSITGSDRGGVSPPPVLPSDDVGNSSPPPDSAVQKDGETPPVPADDGSPLGALLSGAALFGLRYLSERYKVAA